VNVPEQRRRIGRTWTIQDLADFLQVPVKTLYQWRVNGYGPYGRKVGRHVRYDEAEVLRWWDEQRQSA
jgi:predicted DNA-binding transcriptional regulator AlpA